MNTRTSKLIFPAILFLFACLIAFGENGPTPKIVVGSSGISDGSVTPAKLSGPIPIANGGTGATTAAAGLAALGGASLNGSSTVAFNASTINGVVPLTAAEKTQALVGSSTVDFLANNINMNGATNGFTRASKGFMEFGTFEPRLICTFTMAEDTAAVVAIGLDAVHTNGTYSKFEKYMSFRCDVDGATSIYASGTAVLSGGGTIASTMTASIASQTVSVYLTAATNYTKYSWVSRFLYTSGSNPFPSLIWGI